MNFELFVCTKYMFMSDRRSLTHLVNLLALTGIAVGLMVLIVAMAIITGFESEFESRILSVDPHIFVTKEGNSLIDSQSITDELIGIAGVSSVDPVVYSQVVFRGTSNSVGAFLKGVDFMQSMPSYPIITNNDSSCSNCLDFEGLLGQDGERPIVLGNVLADKLGASCGEVVYLLSPIGKNELPLFVPFRIVALLQTGIYQYDELLAYVDISDAHAVLNIDALTSSIEIKVDHAYEAGKIAKKVRNRIGTKFFVKDWTEINANLFLVLKIQKKIMFLILFLIIVVAALSVASVLIMTVLGKMSDIAILKSMGVSNFGIKKIFILRGVSIGLLGSIVGVLAGLFVCALLARYEFINLPGDVYSLSILPIDVSIVSVIVIFLITLFICFLFTLYPAHKASLLSPINGIRRG